jgi:hypothetical protein
MRAQEIMDELKKRFIKERLYKAHLNCVHNHRCVQRRLDFHYCSLKTDASKNMMNRLFLCEDEDWAKNCGDFKNKQTYAEAEAAFNEIIRSPSQCGKTFPHLAALIWVLSEGTERSPERQDDSLLARVWRSVVASFRSDNEPTK